METYFAFLYIPGLSHSVLVKEKKSSLRNIVPTIYIGQAKSQPHKNQSSNNLIMYSKLSVLFFSLDQKPNTKQQMSAKVFDVVSFWKEERPMKKKTQMTFGVLYLFFSHRQIQWKGHLLCNCSLWCSCRYWVVLEHCCDLRRPYKANLTRSKRRFRRQWMLNLILL